MLASVKKLDSKSKPVRKSKSNSPRSASGAITFQFSKKQYRPLSNLSSHCVQLTVPHLISDVRASTSLPMVCRQEGCRFASAEAAYQQIKVKQHYFCLRSAVDHAHAQTLQNAEAVKCLGGKKGAVHACKHGLPAPTIRPEGLTDIERLAWMQTVLQAKVEQNEEVRATLRSTAGRPLEHSGDRGKYGLWTVCHTQDGKAVGANALGTMWMAIRDTLPDTQREEAV